MMNLPEQGGEDTMPVVLHRLSSLERQLESLQKAQTRGFDDVRSQISSLTFVQQGIYEADQRTADQVHKELAKDIEDLGTQMKLLWTVVGGSVIAGLLAFLVEIGQR